MDQNQARMKADAPMDLVDLLKRLAISWRAILLFALIGGLLFYGFYRLKRGGAAQTAPDPAAGEEAGDSALSQEALRGGLTEADYNAVMLAVRDTNLINERSRYLEQSVWVNQSANGSPSIRYLISLKSDGITGSALRPYYKYYFESADFIRAVGSLFAEDIPENDLREMITVSITNYTNVDVRGDPSTFELSILLPGSVDKDAMDELVTGELAALSKALSASVGAHSAAVLSSDLRTGYDVNAVSRKREILYELYNLRAQLKSTVGDFSSAQNVLYNKLTGDGSAAEAEDVPPAETAAAPLRQDGGAGKKYLLAGIAIAVFLFAALAALISLLTGRIHSVREMTGIPCIGEIREFRAASFADALLRSRFVYRLFYGKAEREKVLDLTRVMAGETGKKSLTVVSTVSPGSSNEVDRLIDHLHETEISAKRITLAPGEAILPSELIGSESLVLVLEAGFTRYRDVRDLYSACSLCGIPVPGYILIGR